MAVHDSDIRAGWGREGENEISFKQISEARDDPRAINLILPRMTHERGARASEISNAPASAGADDQGFFAEGDLVAGDELAAATGLDRTVHLHVARDDSLLGLAPAAEEAGELEELREFDGKTGHRHVTGTRGGGLTHGLNQARRRPRVDPAARGPLLPPV